MVRAAQASPDHGLCGVRAARAGDPSCLELRYWKAGASQSCTGAGGTVGQPESAAAHWLPASLLPWRPRVTVL